MDSQLATLVDQDTPKINAQLANGLAFVHMKRVEQYVDEIFCLTSKDFPPGLQYCGYRRCTVAEEFKERTKRRENKYTFDIAHSSIFMVKYFFKLNGEDLPDVHLYLPYVGEGGTIMLGGSMFTISPILSDRVISVGLNSVFVKLLRGKVTFMRTPQQICIGDKRETVQVIYGLIYNKNSRQSKFRSTIKASTTLTHYLFCKYGVTEAFKRYAKTDIVVGYGSQINTGNYPEDEWVICSSMGIKPKTLGKSFYKPTEIRIAIKKSEFNNSAKQMVAGFYYLADHFPNRVDISYLDNVSLWRILLGHILISGEVNEGVLLTEMGDHIKSLDEYIDSPVAISLFDIGIKIKDFYDLMAVVNDKYSDWMLEANDNIGTMYNKELSVLYYVLYEISSNIFKLYFKLKAAGNKPLNKKEVESIFKQFLRTGLVFSITKTPGNVSSSSYSGDNKCFKFTSILTPQDKSSKLNSSHGKSMVDDPTRCLHASIAEIGSYTNIPKAEPDGRTRINFYMNITDKAVIVRDPKKVKFLDNLQSMIK